MTAVLLAGALGVVAGAVAAVSVVCWLMDRIDRATTSPDVADTPVADVIDLAGRRSTGSWTA